MQKNKYYINCAQKLLPEIQQMFNSVSDCLNKSEMFPCYLTDLQNMINNLVHLNVAQNVVDAQENDKRLSFLNKKKKRKVNKKT